MNRAQIGFSFNCSIFSIYMSFTGTTQRKMFEKSIEDVSVLRCERKINSYLMFIFYFFVVSAAFDYSYWA